ncbi:MAG: HDOD domain-containing protein, partial [Sulfurimonas sp.]|nr:HDOD domain-containing protein [Sulfurimonas sp.]
EDPENVENAINDLFRTFHSYKATSNYLSLTNFHSLVSRVEIVLGSLREEKKVVQDSIIEWLLQIKDQLSVWLDEMQKNETQLSKAPEALCGKIKVSKSYISSKEILKKLNILYIDRNDTRAKKVTPFLKKILKDIKYDSNFENSKKLIENAEYDILMVNLHKNNHEYIDYCREKYPDIPIIVVFDKISSICRKKLLKKGISHAITNPLNAKNIQRELVFIVKTYYSSKKIIIDNKKIINFIQTLQPLPNTIYQIMQVCDDDELSIKELINVVKTDPIIAGNILNAANSPLYGSTGLKTIDQAVSRLGKTAVKALTMSCVYKTLGDIDLTPYSMNEEMFSKVSMTRLSLMLKWYSKVSIAHLSILTSTALLGNIGQLLVSKEVISIHKDDLFKELSSTFDTKYAEESILHTTVATVSSQILNYWKLSSDIVDVIAYSDNHREAPEEIRKIVVANFIVYSLVSINGTISSKIPDDILVLMAKYSLDPKLLSNALEYIHNIK